MNEGTIVAGGSGSVGYETALEFASNKIDIVLLAIKKQD